jgi:hypothetical protein
MPEKIPLSALPFFRPIMFFKFFMVILVWGLIPIMVPAGWWPFFGFTLTAGQIVLLRIWGFIVLLDFFLYLYIYKFPENKLSKYLLLFGVIDNAGIGLILLIATLILKLPWGVWANIPFQIFFGYWFWKFFKQGKFKNNKLLSFKT